MGVLLTEMKSIRTNDSLAQPQGSSGPRMTIQKHLKLGPDGLAFNLPHCSVLEYGSPQQPKESVKGLRAEGCLFKALPRDRATNLLLKKQLGSVSQDPPQGFIEIKHQAIVHSNPDHPSNLPRALLTYLCTQDYIMATSASSPAPQKKDYIII